MGGTRESLRDNRDGDFRDSARRGRLFRLLSQPLYSTRITLQPAATLLFLAGAIVGASVAIFTTAHASPTLQPILLGLLVIAAGSGVTAGIIRITDSHVAQLPPSARMVTIGRRKVQRWIWRIAGYLAISAAAALAIPSDWALILAFVAHTPAARPWSHAGHTFICGRRGSISAFRKCLRHGPTTPHDPPPRLTFVFQTFNASNLTLARKIPIPPGGEPDVGIITEKLRACCP